MAPPPPQTSYGATERAFVELAIATDEQALKLLDLTDAPMLKTNRTTELTELRKLLDAPYVNNHAGHDMPGMPTDAEIELASTNPDALKQFVHTHPTESLDSRTGGRVKHGPLVVLAVCGFQRGWSPFARTVALGWWLRGSYDELWLRHRRFATIAIGA